jgi:Ni,Fe-hydrogenase III large subunit/Ni,Fe-hydrogenase III component G
MNWFELKNNPGSVSLNDIPVLLYPDFMNQTAEVLENHSNHCVNYFVYESAGVYKFFIIIANDASHKIFIYSHQENRNVKSFESLTAKCFQLHVFEREIHEKTGIIFEGHPWLKPVRYPFNRYDIKTGMDSYPFYKIETEELHEVGVGPVHAGIIEPGHFRFLCHGEKVHHLEIQLGYQHRGVENLFVEKENLLQRSVIAEGIAGDTTVGHTLAFSQLVETLAGKEIDRQTEIERIIALEMERMAVNIGDTAALCGDVAYQLGQVACEALRTIIINTTQDWCGNRFGKGLIRPGGSNWHLNSDLIEILRSRLADVNRRFLEVTDLIYNSSGIQARYENIGTVSRRQAVLAGAVGMAARTCGVNRDIRSSHPFQALKEFPYHSVVLEHGDVFARAVIRKVEFELSWALINNLLDAIDREPAEGKQKPCYNLELNTGVLGVSLVEGWRGEICHVAITDDKGRIVHCKIKDPSLHNWHMLALAVREQEISDFPVCNKSFNLSYCGNDL